MSYSLHPLAEADVVSAVEFYRQRAGLGVAGRFLTEFDRVARLLSDNPGFGTPFGLPRRIFPLRGFPCLLVYTPQESGARVLALRHHRQLPRHGLGRT